MRTTIDIDDPILKALKALQRKDGRIMHARRRIALSRLAHVVGLSTNGYSPVDIFTATCACRSRRHVEALIGLPHVRCLAEEEGF